MAKHILVSVAVLFLSIASLMNAEGLGDDKIDYATPSSQKYSPFVKSFYEALKSENVFDILFNISFHPREVGPEVYRQIRQFMVQLGVKNPRVLPAKVADATVQAFKNGITSFEYFKVYADAAEATFKIMGVLNKRNQNQVIQLFVSTLRKAVKIVGGSGPKAGITALRVGTVNFIKELGAATPSQAKNHIQLLLAELLKM